MRRVRDGVDGDASCGVVTVDVHYMGIAMSRDASSTERCLERHYVVHEMLVMLFVTVDVHHMGIATV